MLATLSEAVPSGPEWLYEIKWDGVRGLAFLTDRTRLYFRKRTPIDRQYPELASLHQLVNAQSAVLDGEVVALDPAGRPSFERLQPRIMASDPTAIANLARTRPVLFFAFDIAYLNGRDLRKTPLVERKQILQSIIKPGGPLRLSDQLQHGRELLEVARQQALEGIVAKRGDSPYCSGRSRDWVKIKVTREQEFVIAGYTEGEREYFGALILGIYNEKGKRMGGQCGDGIRPEDDGRHSRQTRPARRHEVPIARSAEDSRQDALGASGTCLHGEIPAVDRGRAPSHAGLCGPTKRHHAGGMHAAGDQRRIGPGATGPVR